MAEVAGAIKDGLLAFASATGLVVMHQMMQAELAEVIGEKHAKIGSAGRSGNWHGTTKGSVVLGGRRVSTERPRGRTTTGGEIELDTWKAFSSADLLNSLVVERMLAGVATRRHVDVAEPVGKELEARSRSTSKSAVSRRFVTATTKAMGELMARDLSNLDVAVLMIDGLDVAGSCVVVSLVITADGTKVPVGLWLGDTENKTVVTALSGRPRGPGTLHRLGRALRHRRGQGARRGHQEGVRRDGQGAAMRSAQAQECRGAPAQRAGRDHRQATGPHLRPA